MNLEKREIQITPKKMDLQPSFNSPTESLLKELKDQKFALDEAAIVAATDRMGTITYVNSKFCQVSGYDEKELLGQNHRILNSGYHQPSFFIDLWKTIAKGQVWRGEICNRKKNGDLYWVSTCIVPFLDRNQSPYQYLSIRHEITDLKEAQAKIFAQQLQLASSARLSALGEVSAGISHEINNPLGVILGRVEMLQDHLKQGSVDLEFLKKSLQQIEETALRIESIIKSMRVFAHGGNSDGVTRTDEVFSPQELLRMIHNLVSEKFQKAQVELSVRGFDQDRSIVGSSTFMLQIAVNLLSNAFDAVCDLHKGRKQVFLSLFIEEGFWVLEVRDSGPGIPREIRDKIFQPFFTTKAVRSGTGLGLSLSRAMAQKMGGDLEWDKEAAETTFKVRIPFVALEF